MSSNRTTVSVRAVSAVSGQSIILTVLFSALGAALPVIFHQLGIAAIRFSPMHFPVLLASLLLGPVSGIITGIFSVLFSMIFTGMPMLFPTGIAMLFELAAYGFFASFIHKKCFNAKKGYFPVLTSLIIAMTAGRAVHALVQFIIASFSSSGYSLLKFWNSCFVVSFPGIVIQIILLPLLALAVSRSGLLQRKK